MTGRAGHRSGDRSRSYAESGEEMKAAAYRRRKFARDERDIGSTGPRLLNEGVPVLELASVWCGELGYATIGCPIPGFGCRRFRSAKYFAPAQLKLAAQAGSSTAVTEIFSLFSSGSLGPNSRIDLSIRYGSAPAGWLSVNRIHGTTPATLTISADPSNLPVGTYSAQIVATVGPLQLSAVTAVSFIVAPGGSNPGGLAVNPSSLTFFADPMSFSPEHYRLQCAGSRGVCAFLGIRKPFQLAGYNSVGPRDARDRQSTAI